MLAARLDSQENTRAALRLRQMVRSADPPVEPQVLTQERSVILPQRADASTTDWSKAAEGACHLFLGLCFHPPRAAENILHRVVTLMTCVLEDRAGS
jgi:hypothetical protein